MQCPNCQFENIPGTVRCVRCSAPLQVECGGGHSVDYMPPRAGWKKHWRWVWGPLLRVRDRLPPWPVVRERLRVALLLRSPAGASLDGSAMVASIVPGLGHLLKDKRRRAATYFGVWLLLIAAWLLFMPITVGNAAIGLALGLHVAAVAGAGDVPRVHRDIRSRLGVAAFLLLFLGSLYLLPFHWVRSYFTFVRANCVIAALDVRETDILRFTRQEPDRAWRPAEICLARFPLRRHYDWGYPHVVPRGPFLGLRIADAGNHIVADRKGIMRDNSRLIANEQLEAMGIPLPSQPVGVTIPPEHSLVIFPLPGLRIGEQSTQRAFEEIYSDVYIVPSSGIVARGVSVYLPFRRRHRLAYGDADFLEETID